METLKLECFYAQHGEFKENYTWSADLLMEVRKNLNGKQTFVIEGTSADKIDKNVLFKRHIHSFRALEPGELEFLVIPEMYQPIFYTMRYDGEYDAFIGWWEWINPADLKSEFGGYAAARATKSNLTRKEKNNLAAAADFLRLNYYPHYQMYGASGHILLTEDFGRVHRSPEGCSFEAARAYFKEHMQSTIKKLDTQGQQQSLQ